MNFLFLIVAITASVPLSSSAETKKLKICFTPWFGGSDARNFGPDYEMSKDFASKFGYEATFKEVKYSDLFNLDDANKKSTSLLSEGICELYATSITLTPDRQKIARIIPIYPGRSYVVTHLKSKRIVNVKELNGLKTSVVKGTSYQTILENINAKIEEKNRIRIEITPAGGNLGKLLDRKIDFLVMDAALAFATVINRPKELRLGFPVGDVEQIGWAVAKDAKLLSKQVAKYAADEKNQQTGSTSRIFKKYFGLSFSDYQKTILSVTK